MTSAESAKPASAQPSSGHHWEVTAAEGIAIQKRLRSQVVLTSLSIDPQWIAGVDVGFVEHGRLARGAVVLYRLPELAPTEEHVVTQPVTFPYVPGLLSFRELPVILEALQRLSRQPDLILCDGQGIAHPRRLGIAAHLGVVTTLPTIGVGKSRLIGEHREPGIHKGDWAPLTYKGERIGSVLRTRDHVRPLFVSPGHQTSHENAIDWVLRTTTRYRLPEPIRSADRLASNRGAR